MPMEKNRPFDLGQTMLDRTSALIQMSEQSLYLNWAQQFELLDIKSGCERIASAEFPTGCIQDENIQKELIQNAAFAAYYAKLLHMASDEEKGGDASTPMEQMVSRAGCGIQKETINRYEVMYGLSSLLACCWKNDRDVTAYPADRVFGILGVQSLPVGNKLILLDNFSGQEFSGEKWENAIENLCVCTELPLKLTDGQKDLLTNPFVATRALFAREKFDEIWAVLEKCPTLTSIMSLLHEKEIWENLSLREYKGFMDDVQEYYTYLEGLADKLGTRRMGSFLRFWAYSACPLSELKQVTKQLSEVDAQELDSMFVNYSSYANMLYKNCFKVIDLTDISDGKEIILVYAMSHKKKHFVNLVDSNAELFHSLPRYSVLFQRKLYEEHFNLNVLTARDLADCAWMNTGKLNVDGLEEGRTYTFPELKALYNTPSMYRTLYHMLTSGSQDYRLKVFRQLQKRDLLAGVEEENLPKLAEKLNIKSLYDWLQDDFRHIDGLTAVDAVQVLIHYKSIEPLLSGIRCRLDALLVLRNLKSLAEFDSVEALKANMTKTDENWELLANDMQLSDEFQKQHQKSIIEFLCNDGAHIARLYQECLDNNLRSAFHRVVKAELMGKLSELKYFEGDLQRELELPLNNLVVNEWKGNLAIAKDGMEAKEYDDFFSTMLLGVQPQRTCMSYKDGVYRACLLSAFDSNKKVLYVTLHGRIVARAFLRLTKGRLTESKNKNNVDFTFVDLENVADSRKGNTRKGESLVLFLERPYFGGINPEMENKAKELLVELACKKADELGTMLVLNTSYSNSRLNTFTRTQFNIFISKTKAGAQYLDSLDGEATVDTEGSYKANTFLVRENQQ